MPVNPAIRRALHAIDLAREHDRLTGLLEALVLGAVRLYRGEPVAATWPHIAALVRRHVAAAADAGAFAWFGVRDSADLAYVPDVLYPAGGPDFAGLVGVDVRDLVRLIRAGGTGREWRRPAELELAVSDAHRRADVEFPGADR